jgi:hypothetical protein
MDIGFDPSDPTGAGLMIGRHKVTRRDCGKMMVERETGDKQIVYREEFRVTVDGKDHWAICDVPAERVDADRNRASVVRAEEAMVTLEAIKRAIERQSCDVCPTCGTTWTCEGPFLHCLKCKTTR